MARHRWDCWVWALLLAGAMGSPSMAQPARPGRGTIYVGDSPAAQDLLEQARALRQQNRLLESANLYQQILEQYPDKLMEWGGIYTDAARRVSRDLASDAALLEAYRRAYEPAAERALAAASTPEALESVMARHWVCRAGLEAALRLAAALLERGQPLDAATALEGWEDHPDQATLGPRWDKLQAVSALLAGRPALAARHREALVKARAGDAAAELDQLAEALKLPAEQASFDATVQVPRTAALDRPEKPLWQVAVPDPLGEDARRGARAGFFPESGVGGAAQGHMTPQADEQRIYVNNFLTVMALDRLSGRVAWTHQPPETVGGQLAVAPWLRMAGRLPDQRGFAFEGQNVLTIVGLALGGNPQFQPAGAGTALVCLDRESGAVRWRLEPKEIDAALLGASFHGTPAVVGGRAVVMVRRNHLSGFQDAFVMAVEMATGKVAWRRYLSSSAAVNRPVGRGMAQLLIERGRIFVSDNLGAAACLDARTGMVRWLTVLPGVANVGDVTINPRFSPRPGGNGWQASAPILVEAGLIVPALSGADGAVLIDPDSGAVLKALTAPMWVESDYYAKADGDVICLGPTTHRLDGGTLEPRWSRKLGKDTPLRPSGRAALTLDRLIIPTTGDKVLTLNLASGEVVGVEALAPTGNLLVLDDQLIVADGLAVRDYMEWTRAYARLKERISAEPEDPRAALALAYLALSAGQEREAMEGVDEALASLRRGGASLTPARQRDAFGQLLGLAESSGAPGPVRKAVFDRLANAASGPADQVAFRLGVGAFAAESGKPSEAAEHYQAILTDAGLAGEPYQRGGATRLAGLEARNRLAALVRAAGAEVYERFDSLAAQRLVELGKQPPDAGALLELARQYPLARCVPAAIAQAGEALEAAGDVKGAAVQLRRAYGLASGPADLGLIAGRLGQALARGGQPRQAMRWLERFRREHPGLEVNREGQKVSVESWLAELGKMPAGEATLPLLTPPLAQPEAVAGRLLTPTGQAAQTWPRDRMLLVEGRSLVLRQGPLLTRSWELALDDERPELLTLSGEQALIWSPASGVLRCIDVASGRDAWPAADTKALLNAVGGEAERRSARSIEERNFDRFLNPGNLVIRAGRVRNIDQLRAEQGNPISVEVNDWVIVMADRLGRVVALDRKTGRRLWQLVCPLDEVSGLELSADTLLVVGSNGALSDAVSGHVMLLDPMSGESRMPMLEEKSPIAWSALGAEGMLVYCTGTELVGRQTGDGRVAWRMPLAGGQGSPPPSLELIDDLLFMLEPAGGLAVMDPSSGQVLNRLAAAQSGGPGGSLEVRAFEQQWQVMTPAQAIALGPDGKVRWRDAINPFGKQLALQMLGERHVVLLSLISGPRMARADDAGLRIAQDARVVRRAFPGADMGGPVDVQVLAEPLRLRMKLEADRAKVEGARAAIRVEPPAPPAEAAAQQAGPAAAKAKAGADAAAADVAMQREAVQKAHPGPAAKAAEWDARLAERDARRQAMGLPVEEVARRQAQAPAPAQAPMPAAEARKPALAEARRKPALGIDEQGLVQQQALEGMMQMAEVGAALRRAAGAVALPGAPLVLVPEPVAGGEAREIADAQPVGWIYKLYVLDRFTGSLVEERELSPLPDPIDPAHALFLENRVVFTTAGQWTVIVPGAPTKK